MEALSAQATIGFIVLASKAQMLRMSSSDGENKLKVNFVDVQQGDGR